MNGSAFVDKLKSLGYPAADKLQGESFDWMFENEEALPFLDWFCSEVGPANLLQQHELDEFAELELEDEGLLDGPQLEEALACLQFSHDPSTQDGSDMTALEEELAWCRERKKCLVQQRSVLGSHHASLCERLSAMDKLDAHAKTQYKKKLEDCHAENTSMNESLHKLSESVTELCQLYKSSRQISDDPSDTPVFLSQIDLSSYHQAEEKFTQQLTAFTKKQFFEGISEMAGQEDDDSRYAFLDVRNPASLLVRGEREEVVTEDCKELTRLQVMFPKCESHRINALVEEKSAQTACSYVETKIKSLKAKPLPFSAQDISSRLKDVEQSLTVIKRELSELSQERIPGLIKANTSYHVSPILCGDYNLKIARQDYFITNQEQVISQLLLQRSRHEFLTMAYEVEEQGHHDTHRLLMAVTLFLQKYLTQLNDRMALMQEPNLSVSHYQRSTVDSRDNFMLNLNKLIGQGDMAHGQLFVAYSDLDRDAEHIGQRVASLRTTTASISNIQQTQLDTLEKSVRECEDLVYSGSSTKGGQPQMTPEPILTAMQQLFSMLERLENVVMETMRDVEGKKKSLRADSLLTTERDLFVYFYSNPTKLRQIFGELNERLEAQLVK